MSNDAKSAWMSQVKNHKKRQHGLPALSTLNPNAGNVEHNINMFNAAQPSTTPVTDAVNGNTAAVCEALEPSVTVELEYEKLPIVQTKFVKDAYYDSNFGNYLPPDYDEVEYKISWTYEVDKQEVIEFLSGLPEVIQELAAEDMYDDELEQLIADDFENILDSHYAQVLNYFKDEAIEDAEEKYIAESVESVVDNDKKVTKDFLLDDQFDMSMRTLL